MLESGFDLTIAPFSDMISWVNYATSSNSEHTRHEPYGS